MTLVEELEQEVKEAMLARDTQRRDALRLILSSLKSAEKELLRPLSEDEELQVLQRERKKRNEAAEAFHAAGRTDQAEKEEGELAILEEFMPEPLSRGRDRPHRRRRDRRERCDEPSGHGARDGGRDAPDRRPRRRVGGEPARPREARVIAPLDLGICRGYEYEGDPERTAIALPGAMLGWDAGALVRVRAARRGRLARDPRSGTSFATRTQDQWAWARARAEAAADHAGSVRLVIGKSLTTRACVVAAEREWPAVSADAAARRRRGRCQTARTAPRPRSSWAARTDPTWNRGVARSLTDHVLGARGRRPRPREHRPGAGGRRRGRALRGRALGALRRSIPSSAAARTRRSRASAPARPRAPRRTQRPLRRRAGCRRSPATNARARCAPTFRANCVADRPREAKIAPSAAIPVAIPTCRNVVVDARGHAGALGSHGADRPSTRAARSRARSRCRRR